MAFRKTKELKKVLQVNKEIYRYNKFKLFFDVIWSRIRYGVNGSDYFLYGFYFLNNRGKKQFIGSSRKSIKYVRKYNDKEKIKYFEDKTLFRKKFKDYILVDLLDVDSSSNKTINIFLNQNIQFIIKPKSGSKGQGIKILKSVEINKQTIKTEFKGYIFESLIVQHEKMDKLYSKSVNSIRIVTIHNKYTNKTKLIGATLKIGTNNSEVDNFAQGSIIVPIDIKSGITYKYGINNRSQIFLFHPNTGKQLIGLNIPNWKMLLGEINKFASIIPEVQLVGWDIAITDKGFEIIEGNHNPAFSLIQAIQTESISKKIESFLKERWFAWFEFFNTA